MVPDWRATRLPDQGDVRAVLQRKRLSLVNFADPGADTVVPVEGNSRHPLWRGCRRPWRGQRARHGRRRTRRGTWEIHRSLDRVDRVCQPRWLRPRAANAAVEVGPAGSTPSAGKPRTWGSGGAERTTRSGKHLLHLQREDQVTTGLAGIAIKAKADPKCRFTSLAHILTPGFLT